MSRILFLAVIIGLLPAGCGYTAKARLSEDYSTVAVPIFRNQTFYREIELDLTQALRKEILAKTNLRVTDVGKAQTVVEGDITDFQLRRLREDKKDQVIEFSVLLTVDVQFRKASGEVLASLEKLGRRAEFQVARGEGIAQARQEAVREMARDIVSLLLNRW